MAATALSMRVLGVGYAADPAEMVQPLWPELAIRLPSLIADLGTEWWWGICAAVDFFSGLRATSDHAKGKQQSGGWELHCPS